MNVSTLVLFLVSCPRLAESWMYLLEARFCSVWLHALPASLGVVQMSSMHLGPQGHSQAGFPRRHGTHLSLQSLKFPGFSTYKLLFCRFSLGVVYFTTVFQTKKCLLNGLPSARALEQPLTSESTQFSWADRYDNCQL